MSVRVCVCVWLCGCVVLRHCQSSDSNFSFKFIDPFIMSSCSGMLWPSVVTKYYPKNKTKMVLVLGAREHFVKKKICLVKIS